MNDQIYSQEFIRIFKLIGWKILKEYENNNSEIKQIFLNLPEISFRKLNSNLTLLVHLGIWRDMPKNYTKLWDSNRYKINRQVCVLIPCSPYAKL